MKYLTFLTVLVVGLASTYAQDSAATEDADPSWADNIKNFLNSTSNAVQNIQIPTLGSGKFLQTIDCEEETVAAAPCNLLDGVSGVNVCRKIGGFDLTLCAPKVFDKFIGTADDQCGCCGGNCLAMEQACACTCQEGRGVLVNHNLFTVFGNQISWKGCYTPSIAANVMNARPEFACYTGCETEEGGEEDGETETAAAGGEEEEGLDLGDETWAPTDGST